MAAATVRTTPATVRLTEWQPIVVRQQADFCLQILDQAQDDREKLIRMLSRL